MRALHKFMICLGLFIVLVGCGQPKSLTSRLGSFQHEVDPETGTTFKVIPTKVIATMSQRQVLPSYQKCLGLSDTQVSSRTKSSFSSSKTSFSLDGDSKSVSAPMMMNLAKVAGEFCLDVINSEVNNNQRKYFPGFNIGGGANAQAYNLSGSMQKFASNCWGRAATDEEISLITNNMTTVNLANSKDTNAALFLCTAILSSGQAIKH